MISIVPVFPGILAGFANLVEAAGRAACSGFVLLMGSRGLWVNGANLKVGTGRPAAIIGAHTKNWQQGLVAGTGTTALGHLLEFKFSFLPVKPFLPVSKLVCTIGGGRI